MTTTPPSADSAAYWPAIEADDLHRIRDLAAHGMPVSQPSSSSRDRSAPLHIAARLARADAARTLLELGASTDTRDAYGTAPLQLAVLQSPHDGGATALVLLTAGADPWAVNDIGSTPLSIAANLAGVPEALTTRLAAIARATEPSGVRGTSTPLHAAARDADVRSILAAIASAGPGVDAHDDAGATPLSLVVRRTLPVRPTRPNPHPLSEQDALTVIEALVAAGASPRTLLADGFTGQGLAHASLAPKPFQKRLDIISRSAAVT